MNEKDLKSLRDAIISAENSLKIAKHILTVIIGDKGKKEIFSANTDGLGHYQSGESHIVEGVFTGESMLGSDGNTYPVPHNYASKSLLVQGSRLKAIIQWDGKITYKIIEEIPYETQIGLVTKNGDKYQIATKTKSYNVLVASVTFHKCSIGDTVSIRIPKGKEATYAIIENILPKS